MVSSSMPRHRLGIALAIALAVAPWISIIGGGSAEGAPAPPPVPVDPAADTNSSVRTQIGDEIVLTAVLGSTFDAAGNPVDPLGGVWSCGEFGCIGWGVAWTYSANFTVVSGCTSSSATCTLRYTPFMGGYWEEVTAVHGLSGGPHTILKTTALWVYADPVLSNVRVTPRDAQGQPLQPDSGYAYAVRDGFDPTAGECNVWQAGPYYTPNPSADPCVTLATQSFLGQRTWEGVLPAQGAWTIYPFTFNLNEGDYIRSKQRLFSAVRVTPDGSSIAVDTIYRGVDDVPNTSSTSSSTSSTTPETATTTPVIAPQPPVVTAALAGAGGTVSGTVAGAPGATITVSIASASGTSCVKLMSGVGVVAVGSTPVVLNQAGEGTFSVDGLVTAGSFVYGTTIADTTSSVGECFTVPAPPSTTSTSSTVPATTTSTSSTVPATTTSTTSTTVPVTTTTVTAPAPGSTASTQAVAPGADRIEVESNAGFAVGGYAQIGTGSSAEVRRIVGFGSLIFDAPMMKSHGAGTAVRAVSPPRRDVTGPAVKVTSPNQRIPTRVGDRLVLRVRCTDAGVGVETCGDTLRNGALLDTSTTGLHTATLRAWDRNGNVTVRSISWVVTPKQPGWWCVPRPR